MNNVFNIINSQNYTLPEPTSLTFKKYDITNQDRTMDGTLVIDYIESKESINVAWDALNNCEFKKLLDIIEDHKSNRAY